MKVILLEKVPGLGEVDKVVDVADGYALNFLFPRHLAVSASGKALKDLSTERNRKVKEAEQELKEIQSQADRLEGHVLTLKEKVNDEDFLYAAVGPQKIAEALVKEGFKVKKSQIQISQPFKQVGEYDFKIKFNHGLESTARLVIEGVKKK